MFKLTSILAGVLALIADPAVRKLAGDVHRLPLGDGSVDLAICRQLLHYCDLDRAVRDIKRVLRQDARLHVVQVIDFRGVPESWDQEWTSFRGVSSRRHLRRKALEECFDAHRFERLGYEELKLRDEYSWQDFFAKHSVEEAREAEVRAFFELAPRETAEAIDLVATDERIAYNRLFGAWLLSSE